MHIEQLNKLKKSAHHLKPIILIGQKGLSPAVVLEIEQALKAHELVKIKISGWEKIDREQMIVTILAELKAELIQSIGHMVTIFRKNNE
jgi:RNA-binding protein